MHIVPVKYCIKIFNKIFFFYRKRNGPKKTPYLNVVGCPLLKPWFIYQPQQNVPTLSTGFTFSGLGCSEHLGDKNTQEDNSQTIVTSQKPSVGSHTNSTPIITLLPWLKIPSTTVDRVA